ncbi:MAG TPA: AAA family ATPase, partial [Lachnospiraceae bacterium]|nr:AAA family ATPase [Lachnospiraceae bacterium]
ARAFMDGRLNVAFEDIEAVAPAVLRHRIILSFDAIQDNVSADDVIKNM